jgi:hypothetical protein
MLPPDQSPLHLLLALWRKSRLPTPPELSACRIALFTAATREIDAQLAAGVSYDPLSDQRFLWAAQWLAVAAGLRPSIDPDVEFSASLLMNPTPLSFKSLAAADH